MPVSPKEGEGRQIAGALGHRKAAIPRTRGLLTVAQSIEAFQALYDWILAVEPDFLS